MDSQPPPTVTLVVLGDTFAIHRLPPTAEIPLEILRQEVFSLTRTPQELSLCDALRQAGYGLRDTDKWA